MFKKCPVDGPRPVLHCTRNFVKTVMYVKLKLFFACFTGEYVLGANVFMDSPYIWDCLGGIEDWKCKHWKASKNKRIFENKY